MTVDNATKLLLYMYLELKSSGKEDFAAVEVMSSGKFPGLDIDQISDLVDSLYGEGLVEVGNNIASTFYLTDFGISRAKELIG